MKSYLHLILLASMHVGYNLAETASQPTPVSPPATAQQPIYHQDKIPGYIPHQTYPYAESYDPSSGYEGYLIPAGAGPYAQYGDIKSSMTSSAKGTLSVMLKVLAKVGLFLLGGVALLFVGGAFTTAVCSLTPICTITFNGFKDINKDAMRSYVTPERVASAAAFVENAVDKYQRLQRAIG